MTTLPGLKPINISKKKRKKTEKCEKI